MAAFTDRSRAVSLVSHEGGGPYSSRSCFSCSRPSAFAAQINSPIQAAPPSKPTTEENTRTTVTPPSWPWVAQMPTATDANGNSDVGPAEWPTVRAASLDPAEPAQAQG